MKKMLALVVALVGVGLVAVWNHVDPGSWSGSERQEWTPEQIALIQSLSLSRLPPLPADPSNAVADAAVAAQLGHLLYFDARLSGNGAVACASCHRPELYFTDGLALAMGTAQGPRHTPSLVGLSYSPWFYWDGRKDSQWSQALAPLESGHEHNIDRLSIARLIVTDPTLTDYYQRVFGPLPPLPTTQAPASPLGTAAWQAQWQRLTATEQQTINRVFSNVGKALAAYQRQLLPGRSRFDEYADSLGAGTAASNSLSAEEIAGLALFIGPARCLECHNGPLFTNHEFHNTGILTVAEQLPSMGRYEGIREAREDPFNCLGEYSDAEPGECIELRFARDDNALVGAHKTPTLRNVTETAPYMHGGQLATLEEVLQHYNEAPVSMLSHNEAKPLNLRPVQLRQLAAFLSTLTAALDAAPAWLRAPGSGISSWEKPPGVNAGSGDR